jgi:D-3-phosphoglycerate dehydrogenase
VLVTDAAHGALDIEAEVRGAAGHELLAARRRPAAAGGHPADHPVLVHPRALLIPHVAWYSEEAELRRRAAENVVTWAATGRPDYVVVEGR